MTIRKGPVTIEFLLMPSIARTMMPPAAKPSAMIQSISGNQRKYQISPMAPTTMSVIGSDASFIGCAPLTAAVEDNKVCQRRSPCQNDRDVERDLPRLRRRFAERRAILSALRRARHRRAR